jgi:hypothetical protein
MLRGCCGFGSIRFCAWLAAALFSHDDSFHFAAGASLLSTSSPLRSRIAGS